MPNLIIDLKWNPVINEIAFGELARGGPDGNINAATRQLAENIFWLKDDVATKQGEIVRSVTAEADRSTQKYSEIDAKTSGLQDQVNSIGGGKFAYTTYAEMVAAANLPAGDPLKLPEKSSVDVINNTDDPTKNGTYGYDGSVFTKSPYDPLALAKADATTKDNVVKAYAEDRTKNISQNNDNPLDVAVDKNGDAYRYTDANGYMHVTGLDKAGSVQSNINTLHEQSKNIPTIVDDNILHIFADDAGAPYAYFDKDADLQLVGDVYKNGVLIAGGSNSVSTKTSEQIRHQSILLQKPKIKSLVPIATVAEDGFRKRMPFGIVTPTGLVYFYHKQLGGYDGDLQGSEIWKAIITIDAELNVTVVSRELFLSPDEPRGIVKHPTLGRTSDGRIILIFEKRLEINDSYLQYQCYSSDEGLTFTTPTRVSPTGVNPAGQGSSALGTTGTIIKTKSNRLLIPMYTLGGTCYVIYSDNDGTNWAYSDWVKRPAGQDWVEPSICFDANDNILMDMRPFVRQFVRGRAISYDNGLTWQYLGNTTLLSADNQGTIFKDSRIGALIQTHNATGTNSRTKYSLSLSYDNDVSYPYRYQPFEDSWYGGYSQILKWSEGIYIVIIEYADSFISVNNNENSALILLSLSEVLSNVSYN